MLHAFQMRCILLVVCVVELSRACPLVGSLMPSCVMSAFCQVSAEPPQIALFCNNPKLFNANYKTYLENKLRQDLATK